MQKCIVRVGNSSSPPIGLKAVIVGSTKVYTGVTTGRQVARYNQSTGLYELVNEVVDKEVYNVQKVKRSCWFALDLETGGRGWFPGAKTKGNAEAGKVIYVDEEESSALVTLPNTTQVQILTSIEPGERQKHYHIKCYVNGILYTGYMRAVDITNIAHYPN